MWDESEVERITQRRRYRLPERQANNSQTLLAKLGMTMAENYTKF